ncbi:MAG: polysaccharide deacetylase family protein [Oscillospiraceae bacterium]|nr:polysaccharide deacetylase family protein [Oscillospiraceae bacterium]
MVIKAKYLVIAAAAAILIPIICVTLNKSAEVFNVNGREIPIYSVERDDNKIALTFDCAWNDDDIDQILDTLDEYDCKATFFVLGSWAEKYSESLAKIKNRGHEIGNHSYNHADYTKLSAEQICADLRKADEIIENIIGETPSLMRAPSGGYNNTVVTAAEGMGKTYIQWSVDGIDYGDTDAQSIFERSTSKTGAGDIILLHNGTEHTAEILPRILETLGKNYEFATVSELIYSENFVIDNNGCQRKK